MHGLRSFSELRGRGWLGFIKAFLRRSPGEIPKSFCGRRSRDLCEMLCEFGCVMRAEAEGLLIIVSA